QVLRARPSQRLLTPRVPVHRILRVLQQIGTGLASEAIGHRFETNSSPAAASSATFGRSVDVNSSGRRDVSLQAVLAKLEPADRQVVLDALEAAQKTETELRYLADHDPLTALLNRRAFRVRLDTYVNFAARYGGRGAVMVIDVDGLKEVNDKLGHQQGDNLIRRVATILRERVRGTDIVARLSGDEFAVLMPQSDVEGALQLGDDLRIQVADDFAAEPDLAGRRSASGSRCSGPNPT